METRRTAGPTPGARVPRLLPRSRTVALLRTPAPYRHLAVVLALVAVPAALWSLLPALSDRARLTEAMFAAASFRIDPSLVFAERGRWPGEADVALPEAGGNVVERGVSADGIEVLLQRDRDLVTLGLHATPTPGGTVRWHCDARAADAERPLDPLSVPEACRP